MWPFAQIFRRSAYGLGRISLSYALRRTIFEIWKSALSRFDEFWPVLARFQSSSRLYFERHTHVPSIVIAYSFEIRCITVPLFKTDAPLVIDTILPGAIIELKQESNFSPATVVEALVGLQGSH